VSGMDASLFRDGSDSSARRLRAKLQGGEKMIVAELLNAMAIREPVLGRHTNLNAEFAFET